MKPHIKTLPCFPQVAAVIGDSRAQIELFKAHWTFSSVYFPIKSPWLKTRFIRNAFKWDITPQGYIFWKDIEEGINPYHD